MQPGPIGSSNASPPELAFALTVPVASPKKRPRGSPHERLLAAALGALGEGVIIASARWQRGGFPIVFANASLCALTGWSAAELRGQLHGCLHAEPRALTELRRWRASAHPTRTFTAEGRLKRRTGEPLEATWTLSPVADARGRVSHVAITYRDLTAKRRLQDELIHAQRLEAVDRLAGGVAHDFNNLLSVINGYCEILSAKPALREGARELGEIHRAGIEAAGLVRQLLAFSRRQAMDPQVVSLNQLVQDNAGILAKLLGADKTLSLALDAATDRVSVEPAQLQQVLLNLTRNARDAMGAGGHLTLRTANQTVAAQGRTRRDDAPPGRYLFLCVEDDGCGMDESMQAKVFEPFYTTKAHGQGIGLGLALVHGVVQQSGGFIRVRSAVGEGSCFEIWLPEVTGLLTPQAGPLGPLPSTQGKETVLLIEADPVFAKMVTGILTADGYTVLAAPHAAAAGPLTRRHLGPIHLLISELNSAESARFAQRLHKRHAELRLIATDTPTSAVQSDIFPRPPHALTKPYALSTLLQTVRAVLDQPAPKPAAVPANLVQPKTPRAPRSRS